MGMRRMTLLTNASSEKWEKLKVRLRCVVRILQLLPDSSKLASDASNGSRDRKPIWTIGDLLTTEQAQGSTVT
jgi:hypothetical protein